jgi:DNA modification methylase
MQNHVASDVYEPFAGSGTTLIAAEQLGRRCFAIELEPRYVQVILDRWAAFTGKVVRETRSPSKPEDLTQAN